MLSINDILSSNLLDNVHAVTWFDMGLAMILSFGMGMFIFLIYGRIYQGAMYSSTFGVSLVGLCMIATTLILAVTSNVVLSLGMVGALSIVRFRTAIKDPMEIVFLFWSIETGIVLATGIYPLGVFVNLGIGGILLCLIKRKPDYPYILVIRCERDALQKVWDMLFQYTEYFVVRSRKAASDTQSKTMIELDIEVTVKQRTERGKPLPSETAFVDDLLDIPGVEQAILVTYHGNYMS